MLNSRNGQSLPAWISFNNQERSFTVLDADAMPLSLPVNIIVNDGRGGSASIELTLQFEPVLAAAEPIAEPVPPVVEQVPAFIDLSSVTSNSVPDIAPAEVDNSDESRSGEEAIKQIAEFENIEFDSDVVDLQSLIPPLSSAAALQFASLETERVDSASDEILQIIPTDIDTIDFSTLIQSQDVLASQELNELANSLDRQREELAEQASLTQNIVGSSIGITSGLSVGYLIWLIRGGTLMGSVLTSLPAWRFVDPLPILDSLADADDDDGESLETLVDTDDHRKSDPAPQSNTAADEADPNSHTGQQGSRH